MNVNQVAHAQTPDSVIVVTDRSSGAVAKFVEKLKVSLKNYRIKIIDSVDITAIADVIKYTNDRPFYITVGNNALQTLVAKKITTPILATFISESSYRTILNNHNRKNITAIFSDPDPDYQMKLIKSLYKKPVKVAVILSESTRKKQPLLQQLAKKNDLDIKIINYNSSDNIYKALNNISNADILLAIPDDNIYNHDSIRTIILTTYRHNQALIGFSSGMVKAGALATIAAELEDIADEISILISNYSKNGKLPAARYYRYFTVKINQHVARSFNVRNTDSLKQIIPSIAEQMITSLETQQAR
ncbi:MAG: hypothetical protein GXP08_17615 [Gammaproteobacteria bacterium]|nr:hypothetical protein [Gammaproteobacteria bacterium]